MTPAVSRKARAAAPHRTTFYFFSVKMDPRRERMLKAWKISAIDMVRNAMVIPSRLCVKTHSFASI